MMHTRAEMAGQGVKIVAGAGASVTSLAWWNTNSSAITAICAFVTVIIVAITAIINWHYKYNYKPKTEANMTKKTKPIKEDKKPTPPAPTPKDGSVPCGDEDNPC